MAIAELELNWWCGLTDRYEPPVRKHLRKVYTVLCNTMILFIVGAISKFFNYLVIDTSAILCGCIILYLAMLYFKDNGKNYGIRFVLLCILAFCWGHLMGSRLILFQIVLLMSVSATKTYAIFLLMTFFTERGALFHLGGMSMSILTVMTDFQSHWFISLISYIFVIMSNIYLYNHTQKIVKQCRANDYDVVQHAMGLIFYVLRSINDLVICTIQ